MEVKPASIEWLTSSVVGAGTSIDILANLEPKTRVDSTIADYLGTITAVADRRLRLRCLVHMPKDPDGRERVRSEHFGSEISEMGWEIRYVEACPTLDLIIIDGSVAHMISGNGTVTLATSDKSGDVLTALQQHFETLWQSYFDKPNDNLIFEDLIQLTLPRYERQIAKVSTQAWDEVIRCLAASPKDMFALDPRKFEELIAELLTRDGMDVHLTPRTRDGGRDILARMDNVAGCHLYLVECKRYAQNRPIGVELVRSLYGVVEHERATAGILVTTSRFTRDALKFVDPIQYRITLREFEYLQAWLRGFTN